MARAKLLMLLLLALPLLQGCRVYAAYPEISFSRVEEPDRNGSLASDARRLRVALATGVSPQQNIRSYEGLLAYLGRKLGRPVEIVQKKTYAEVNELLHAGSVQLAFVCSSIYVMGKAEYGLELVAVPQVQGELYYQSYVIVPADSPIASLEELRNGCFAMGDPLSTTGALYPLSRVRQLASSPDAFFQHYFYTYSHDSVVRAVASKVADGAAVDSTVFNLLKRSSPELVDRVKVVERSTPYGNSPVVARPGLDGELKSQIREILVNMNQDHEGRRILESLDIEGYAVVADNIYDSVKELVKQVPVR